MNNYAVIDVNNIVINLIVADSLEEAQMASGNTCIQYNNHWDTAIGWEYNNETQTFIGPTVSES